MQLDAKYPGSKVLDEKNKYGVNGDYLALVTGSLGNCSADVLVVIDFIAAIKTVRALELRIANRDQLFSMHRRFLISSFGLFTTCMACGLDTFMTAFVMPFLLKLLSMPTSSLTPIARSLGNSTWATPIRAARSTAASAVALKRATSCHYSPSL